MRLIDANALLKNLYDLCKNCENNDGILCDDCDLADAISYVEGAPTIDAQPVKRGKWEWEPGYVGTTAKCSACGLSPMGFYSLPTIQIGRLPEYPFCPKCGAEMH